MRASVSLRRHGLSCLGQVPRSRGLLPLVLMAGLAGCSALPKPDGVEAQIIAAAAPLAPLTAAEGRAGSAAALAQRGLLMSPSVRQAASKVSASADEVRVQRASLFPGLGLSFGGGVGDAGKGDPALSLTGSQLLFDGGNTKRKVKVADFDLQISYLQFQQSVDAALREVLDASEEVQKRSALLGIYRKQLAAMRELETLVAERAKGGATSTSDLLETRKSLQSAAFLVNDAELALAEARDRLLRLSGQAEPAALKLPSGSCEGQGASDQLRLAQLELGRAELQHELAERGRSPRIVLEPVVRAEPGQSNLPTGLNLGVQSDLLTGGALTARANAARNSAAAASANLEVVALEEQLAGQSLQRSLAAGARKLAMLDRQIALLAETRTLYRSQYFDLGTRRLSELLDNEQDYYGRQAERVELGAALAMDRVDCALRSRNLRSALGLENNSLYGFPLSSAAL